MQSKATTIEQYLAELPDDRKKSSNKSVMDKTGLRTGGIKPGFAGLNLEYQIGHIL